MPFGNNDWLALTQESPIEPEIPLCDPHHHFWDRRLQSIPYQRYLLHELMADLDSGHNVRSTVFVEARSMYRAFLVLWSCSLWAKWSSCRGSRRRAPSGVYGEARAAAAIVGHADLKLGDAVAPSAGIPAGGQPKPLQGHPAQRHLEPGPADLADRETEGIMANDSFRAGARVLARMGLSLDVMLSFPQLKELADFARAVPEVPHHPQPPRRDQQDRPSTPARTMKSSQRGGEGIAAVANCPHVTCKLGGMGMPRWGFGWHERDIPIGSEELAESMAPWKNYCIEKFGPERCMFESNFPPDKVSFSLQRDVQRLQAPLEGLQPHRAGQPLSRRGGPGLPN